ncbi:MAG: neutral ceramidase [Bradymonadia bacterium]|jgi:neutral ceramidase
MRGGVAKRDITVRQPAVPMLGWGIMDNTAHGVATPLSVRVFAFDDGERRVTLAVAEILCITRALRDEVLALIAFRAPEVDVTESSLLLSSTHTHSAPGGYANLLYYNLRTPGFIPEVFWSLANDIAECVISAHRSLEPITVHHASGEHSVDDPVAFNRSPEAYSENEDTERVGFADRAHATNRRADVIAMRRPDGRLLGAVHWFACHCTSVHADNHHIHFDNKGIAAQRLEAETGAVVACAQGAAGDVSPNHRFDRRRGKMIGAASDDFESAAIHGAAQATMAARLIAEACAAPALPRRVNAALHDVDFDGYSVDARFAGGTMGLRTGSARVGMSFMEGTAEGPGPLRRLRGLNRVLSRLWGALPGGRHEVYGRQLPFLETGKPRGGRSFGVFVSGSPPPIGFLDPVVSAVREYDSRDAMFDAPWSPNVLPLQLVEIGSFVLAATPLEPTTQAGRRIATLVQDTTGARDVVVAGYANDYSAYLTTPEEYDVQAYEGGSTYFGRASLAGFLTAFERVAHTLDAGGGYATDPDGSIVARVPLEHVYAQLWVP